MTDRDGGETGAPGDRLALPRGVEVVSFDCFDTLVERPFERPTDLFSAIEAEVAAAIGWSGLDYRRERILAEQAAHREAEREGRGEARLDAIHRHLAERLALRPEQASQIAAIEWQAMLAFTSPRPEGARLYEEAGARGLRRVVLSDTYYPAERLGALLGACGLAAPERILASADRGRTKRAGTSYGELVAALGVPAERILHVGDDERSDVTRARAAGLHALHLPRRGGALTSLLIRTLPPLRSLSWEARSVLTLLGRGVGDRLPSDGSVFGDDPWLLGFVAIGPLLLGAALGLRDDARTKDRALRFSPELQLVGEAHALVEARASDDEPLDATLGGSVSAWLAPLLRAPAPEARRGALDFVRSFVAAYGVRIGTFRLRADEATIVLQACLRAPHPRDAALLRGAGLAYARAPLGARIEAGIAGLAPLLAPLLDRLAARTLPAGKLDKLRRQPVRFFSDARGPGTRWIGRIYLHPRARRRRLPRSSP